MEGRPWPEYGRGRKPITTNQIAKLLRPLGIRPGTVRYGVETPKGYKLETFENVFARYLSRIPAATPPQPAENCGKSAISNRHIEENVAAENRPKPAESLTCGGVAAENRESGGERCFEVEDDPEERAAIQEFDGETTP